MCWFSFPGFLPEIRKALQCIFRCINPEARLCPLLQIQIHWSYSHWLSISCEWKGGGEDGAYIWHIGISGMTISETVATMSMQAGTNTQPPARMLMSAQSVMDPNPRCTAPPAKTLHLKCNSEAFREGWTTHGDQDFAKRIIKTCSNGVIIGYEERSRGVTYSE